MLPLSSCRFFHGVVPLWCLTFAFALVPRAEVVDSTFNPSPGVHVWTTITLPSGKILVGGDFTRIASASRSYFARLEATGAIDNSFNAIVSGGGVYCAKLLADGKILIGGRFSTVSGQARSCLARLNADGSLDATFDAHISGNYVRALLALPDGRVVIGGDFASVNGRPRAALARLNADGSFDSNFVADATGTSSATAAPGVFALARQDDGRVVLGGQFTMVNGVARRGIARVNTDGSLDTAFDPGSSALSASIAVLVMQRDGKILVGGGFSSLGYLFRSNFIRLNSDGTGDATFKFTNANSGVFAILEQPDSRILIGGLFTQINAELHSYIARLNADGTPDPTFTNSASGNLSGGSLGVTTIERAPNGNILLGGTFTSVDSSTRSGLARLVPPEPQIIASPASTTAAAGSRVSLTAVIAGSSPSLQWRKDGVPIEGATTPTLTFSAVQFTSAGRYDVVATNTFGTATTAAAVLTVTPAAPRLINVSVRTQLASAQSVIVGFAVTGSSMPVLVRAAGPALAALGLTTAMTDPRLELYRDSSKLLDNDDWPNGLAPTFNAVGAFAFPSNSRDAALQATLTGAHSAVVSGSGSGVVLVEAYDASTSATGGRLVNVSARNRVEPGDGTLIAGFSVSGAGTMRLLIRAVGPTLGGPPFGLPGVLADPKLEIYDAAGARIDQNDNWDASLASTFTTVGAFALAPGSKDAALIVTVTAGASYTAQVRAPDGTTGEALVEIYELP
jgi:uncharacterized delta-60 repeat protein